MPYTTYKHKKMYYITNKMTGQHVGEYETPYKALEGLHSLPVEKGYKYGMTCVETYTYFDEYGFFTEQDINEQWEDELKYI